MPRIGHRLLPLAILSALSLAPTQSPAQDTPPGDVIDRLSASETATATDPASEGLLGPWLPSDCGVSVKPIYCGEVFTNARGGISTRDATQYAALLDVALMLDFEEMRLPVPGRLFLLAQNTHGRGITKDFVGDFQVVSNIDSGRNITQVSAYWWELGLLDESVTVRLGKQDVNTEFLLMDLASDFIHSSFGLSPSAGLPSYPAPGMAALVLAQITESLRLRVGFWDALGVGNTWGISGNSLTITIGELEYKSAWFEGRLPGAVDVGVAYFSGGTEYGLSLPSGYGYYIQLEQLLYRENPCEERDRQGFGVFASYFPRFSSGEVPIDVVWADVVGGIMYRGLVPCRDDDVVGAGAGWAKLDREGTRQETAIEFFYKVQISPSTSLQPDLQYIVSPSGIHQDALAVGLRFQVVL